jgi:hypothetical protein
MKNVIRLSLIISVLFITSSCFPGKKLPESEVVILPLSDTVTLREGSIVYALPRTVFTVVVEMERTIEKPGPYSRFAGDLLGMNNVILSENESWEIISIKVISSQEVDPSEFYVISSNTLFQSNVLALKKEGLILDLDPSSFKTDLAQTASRGSGSESLISFDLGSDEYFQVQRDTAYKRVSVDSSFIRIPYIVEKKKKLTEDQLAEKAAKRLMDLRDGKLLILSGEATVFPQNEAAINEINKVEKEYTELFTGKTLKETRTYMYQVIPSKEMVGKPVTLFRLSETTGPVSANMTVGKPVTIEFVPEQKTKDLTFIDKPQSESVSPGFDKLFYRMPDVVSIKILFGTEQLLSSRRLIYQFGQIIPLPANYIIGK